MVLFTLSKAGRLEEPDPSTIFGEGRPSEDGVHAVIIMRQKNAEWNCSHIMITLGVAPEDEQVDQRVDVQKNSRQWHRWLYNYNRFLTWCFGGEDPRL